MANKFIFVALMAATLFSLNNFAAMVSQVTAPYTIMDERIVTPTSLSSSLSSSSASRLAAISDNKEDSITSSLLSPTPPSSSFSTLWSSASVSASATSDLLNKSSISSNNVNMSNNNASNYAEMNAELLPMFPQAFSVHEHYFGRSRNGTTIVATNDTNEEEEEDVSILTQISLDRFQQVIDLNRAWNGYMSVAVYLKEPDELIQFRQLYREQQELRQQEYLQQQQQQQQQQQEQQPYQYQYGFHPNKVSFHLVSRGNYTGEYPINVLRNVALEHAVTRYVFLLDADFTPSPDARCEIIKHIRLRRAEQQAQKQAHEKQLLRSSETSNSSNNDDGEDRIAWVLPAFEREVSAGETVRPEDLPKSKNALKNKIWEEDEYYIFHRSYRKAHRATEYQKWYRTNESYDVMYSVPYEPYVVVDRLWQPQHSLQSQLLSQTSPLPRFHPAFTGYGYSKLSWAEELAASGYKFRVIPSAWVIHINHEHTGKYRTSMRTMNETALATYRAFQEYVSQRYGIPWPPPKKSECDLPNRNDFFPGLFVQPNYLVVTGKGGGNHIIKNNINSHADAENATSVHLFSSYDNDDDDNIDVSIATQITMDKFERVIDLYSRWTAHISVAIYIEASSPKEERQNLGLLKQLIAQHFGDAVAVGNTTTTTTTNATELQSQRLVSFHVVLNRGPYDGEYPINLMRNVAMDNAVTKYVFVLDVDFIPSPDAHDAIRRHLQSSEFGFHNNNRTAFVIPAFEREIREGQPAVTVDDLPRNKEELVDLLTSSSRATKKGKGTHFSKKKQYFSFHRAFKAGHGPTQYRRWYHTKKPYKIKYQLFYEPYVVVKRAGKAAAGATNNNYNILPRFYEAFTGFGRNKQSWIEELAAAEYEFVVLPDAFIIHINHHYGKYELGTRAIGGDTRRYYQTFQSCLGSRYNRTWPPPELLPYYDDD